MTSFECLYIFVLMEETTDAARQTADHYNLGHLI